MKIRKLRLKNIGVFDDKVIEFGHFTPKNKAEIHIFTGQNGSGKSTILMALASAFNFYSSFDSFSYPREVLGIDINSFSKRFHHIINPQNEHMLNSFAEINFSDGARTIVRINERSNRIYSHDFHDDKEELGYYRLLLSSFNNQTKLKFAVFAFSGYRRVEREPVEAIYELKDFNPLSQSLEFVKDYSKPNQLTINQLIANNFSKRWIESNRDKKKSERFKQVLTNIEQTISDITGWRIEFDLQTEPLNLIARVNDEDLDFDVLPDGLRSLISWIADLAGRIDLLKWEDDLPIFEKNLILFLDEIEIHLHPAWQRKVLPVVQKLFKNSQIFISTHSPFVINSVDDAWVYKLELENGKARVAEVVKSEDGHSYSYVLSEIFDIKEEFGIEVQKDLAKFKELRNKILASNNGSEKSEKELLKLAKSLAVQSEELQTIVQFELRQINKRTGKSLTI
jgi:predicted ATP-binding protein involved in virulence